MINVFIPTHVTRYVAALVRTPHIPLPHTMVLVRTPQIPLPAPLIASLTNVQNDTGY